MILALIRIDLDGSLIRGQCLYMLISTFTENTAQIRIPQPLIRRITVDCDPQVVDRLLLRRLCHAEGLAVHAVHVAVEVGAGFEGCLEALDSFITLLLQIIISRLLQQITLLHPHLPLPLPIRIHIPLLIPLLYLH